MKNASFPGLYSKLPMGLSTKMIKKQTLSCSFLMINNEVTDSDGKLDE